MTMSPPQSDFKVLEDLIGLKFKNKQLLEGAFVHRSYLNENKSYRGSSNERLEFLGDSVLSLVVSRFLFEKLPAQNEGRLTMLRASLVRTETLAKIAGSLSLGNYLLMAKGEEESGGRSNSSTLANTFEALTGAIYLDLGFETVQGFIDRTILKNWHGLAQAAAADYKSKLQEVVQRKYHQAPDYKLLASLGPDHARQFQIGVYLGKKLLGRGKGKNKQEAAQDAAADALSGL